SVSVIYRSSTDRFAQAFDIVARDFPEAQFLHQQSISDFKTLTVNALENSSSDYVVFAVDDNIVKDVTSLDEWIEWLVKTNAYGHNLKLGAHLAYCYTGNKLQASPPHQHGQNASYS